MSQFLQCQPKSSDIVNSRECSIGFHFVELELVSTNAFDLGCALLTKNQAMVSTSVATGGCVQLSSLLRGVN